MYEIQNTVVMPTDAQVASNSEDMCWIYYFVDI